MKLVVSSKDMHKMPLLSKLRKETLKTMKTFKIAAGRIYATTQDLHLRVYGDNRNGDLGLGHKRALKEDEEIKELSGCSIKDISIGGIHTLVLTETLALYAWSRRHTKPMLLFDPKKETISAIKAGVGHALALNTEGRVYVWGANYNGQLGTGNYDNVDKPKLLESIDEPVASIQAGQCYSMIITITGRLFGFGINDNQQVDGSNALYRATPIEIQLPEGARAKSVAAGVRNALVLTTDGHVLLTGSDRDEPHPWAGPFQIRNINFESQAAIEHVFAIDFARSDDKPQERASRYEYLRTSSHQRRPIPRWLTLFVACNITTDECFVWGELDNTNIVARPMRSRLSLVNVCWEYTPKPSAPPLMLTWKYIEPAKRNDAVAEKVAQLFEEPGKSDLTFVFQDGTEMKVHKFILKISSSFMLDLLEQHEGQETIYLGDEFKVSIFYQYIKWIYVEQVDGISLLEKQELLELAEKCNEPGLWYACLEAIIRDHVQLPGDGLLELLDLCQQFKLTEVVKKIETFLNQNRATLAERDDFSDISKRVSQFKI